MLRLRRENPAFTDGDVEVISEPEDDYFIYTRTACDESGPEAGKWVVVCNFANESNIAFPFECEEPVLANLCRKTADGVYAPYECSVSRIKLK